METPPSPLHNPPAPTSPPPLRHRSGHPQSDINMAMWCHLIPVIASLMGFGLFAFLGPLIIRQNNQGRSTFVDEHAKESLNFQLSALLYFGSLTIIAIIVTVVTFGLGLFLLFPGILLLGAAAIGVLVLEIIATVKATNGEHYKYILTIPFVK